MKRHALFVGVDQYADGHIPNLSCAVSDATDLHGFFKYGAGYDRVELLQNPAGKKEVLGAVRGLTAGLGSGDFFLFFFAGHGFRVGENHVLVCAKDFYEDVKYEDDGLPLGQLKRRLLGAFNSALFLDACQSDILATRGGEGIAERDLSLIHEAQNGEMHGGALTIVTSCDAGQTAAELSAARHGLFTMAMLDLLKSAQGAHTRIDLSDAFRVRLGRKMGEIAVRFGLPTNQRPRFSCTGDSGFVLLEGANTETVQRVHPDPDFRRDANVEGSSSEVTEMFRMFARVKREREVIAKLSDEEKVMFAADIRAFEDDLAAAEEAKKCSAYDVAASLMTQALKTADALTAKIEDNRKREPKPGDEMTITLPGGVPMTFCWCPATTSAAWKLISGGNDYFLMGSPTSEKGRSDLEMQHRVTLTQGFWMGKYEVTQRQWECVMDSNPSNFKGANRPVEKVSWSDCQNFIRKINAAGQVTVALPTEAQWEYACRAGTTTPFNFGSTLKGDKANCDGNYPYGTITQGPYRIKTRDVGSYASNDWGLYDMHGNVWEWCADLYGNYTGDVANPTGPASGMFRVDRGGSWSSYARGCRSASRDRSGPGDRYDNLGFRLVCSAGPRR